MQPAVLAASVSPGAVGFLRSAIGKKVLMAASGVVGFGFVIAHLLGNLQFYLGPEVLNDYAAALRANPLLLLFARSILVLALVVHVVCAVQLARMNRAARPHAYRSWTARTSSFSSRTMLWSGPLLFLFIVYHLLHLTFGAVHPNFRTHGLMPDAYHNVVAGFSRVSASLVYIAAMAMLGFHLAHGVWSMFQSLGMNHSRYMPAIRLAAVVITVLIVLGNISIPVSVMLGLHDEL